MAIPQVINQIWFDPTDESNASPVISDTYLPFVQGWQKAVAGGKLTGFTYRLWNGPQCLSYVTKNFPNLLPLYSALPRWIGRVDIFKYLLLLQDGGIVADTDLELIAGQEQNFIQLLEGKEAILSRDCRNLIDTSLLAAVPGHKVFKDIKDALDTLKPGDINAQSSGSVRTIVELTGSVFITKIVEKNSDESFILSQTPLICPLPSGIIPPTPSVGTDTRSLKHHWLVGWFPTDHNCSDNICASCRSCMTCFQCSSCGIHKCTTGNHVCGQAKFVMVKCSRAGSGVKCPLTKGYGLGPLLSAGTTNISCREVGDLEYLCSAATPVGTAPAVAIPSPLISHPAQMAKNGRKYGGVPTDKVASSEAPKTPKLYSTLSKRAEKLRAKTLPGKPGPFALESESQSANSSSSTHNHKDNGDKIWLIILVIIIVIVVIIAIYYFWRRRNSPFRQKQVEYLQAPNIYPPLGPPTAPVVIPETVGNQ